MHVRSAGSTLFPSTTLFRSAEPQGVVDGCAADVDAEGHPSAQGEFGHQPSGSASHVEDGSLAAVQGVQRSEEHTSELQSRENLVSRLLLEKNKDTEEHNNQP